MVSLSLVWKTIVNLQVSPSSLKEVPTPFTDAGIARPTLSEDEKPGKLQPVASKILMKILFAARMARFDLLRTTQSLASKVTKWSVECDVALHRLVAYITTVQSIISLRVSLGTVLTSVNCGFSQAQIMQVSMTAKAHPEVP